MIGNHRDGCGVCGRAGVVVTAYSARRDTDLPWGYWLRAEHGGGGYVRDEDGRVWESVREAFWCGRLGMPLARREHGGAQFLWRGSGLNEEMIELMVAGLAVCGRSTATSAREAGADLFEGRSAAWSLLVHQLQGWSLAAPGQQGAEPLLTDEGRAVLLMLKATRPPELHRVPPGRRAMELLAGAELANLANPHVDVDALPVAFEREDVGSQPMIVLVDRRVAKRAMPLAETIWSISFDRRDVRDRLYAWLVARTDRWTAWGEMARRHNAAALSAHLLAVYSESLDWRDPTAQAALPAPPEAA